MERYRNINSWGDDIWTRVNVLSIRNVSQANSLILVLNFIFLL